MPIGTREERLTQHQVADLLGYSYDYLRVKRTRPGFPAPDGYLGNKPWWLRGTIEDWRERVA